MFFKKRRSQSAEYDEDFFKDTRMSFGDHLEELRWRMWRAIKGLGLCLVIGFILDSIGDAIGQPWVGVGKPMLKIITDPVKSQVREFYRDRNENTREKLEKARERALEEGATDDPILQTTVIPVRLRGPDIERVFGKPEIEVEQVLTSTDVDITAKQGAYQSGADKELTGLGVMEAFMVYIKVSLLCGVILACPWIFHQMWAFIGAGLYPHEKKLVHVYLPFSIFLFLAGCLVCQFIVMPKAVAAMLSFYKWINVDPDLRLNEWLGFAIVMPLVFGISFQTPLVMLFLNRIGIFGWEQYLAKWRYAMFILAILSAVLTPSTDIISMLWLFVPTFGLYMVGVLICYVLPPPTGLLGPVEEEEEVGV
ncbi:MAG TPA: twin-arginine translocase subunit TatC [Gemmataceae bacterium]|nr:twin-arginine translocase subunit TatC [Gemmataceae bacterium]